MLRLQGQQVDEESGLHYNRGRFYDPSSGRFVSTDPIKLSGGFNLYQYGPSPVQWVDPLGLAGKPFGTGKGQHTATVEVRDSTGKLKTCTTLQSGNMTPEEAALGFPRSTLATHTENRAMRQVPMASGDRVTIKGQYPPCKSCKGAMNRKAAEVGCKVDYVWPEGEWSTGGE